MADTAKNWSKWPVLICLLLMLATRMLSLSYQIELHPDEYKFAMAAESLMEHILDPSVPFVEEKEYPEGAYVFMLPVYFLGHLISSALNIGFDRAIWGRIFSVICFVLSYLTGRQILKRFLHAPPAADWIYGLTMCFSTFFLEHSRYGTGDMISILLIMLIIYLTASKMVSQLGISCDDAHGHHALWFLFICAISGSLAAVKYPLIQFILIPMVMLWVLPGSKSKKLILSIMGLISAFLGLLLFSPKAIGDLGYFLRVIQVEMGAYVSGGTTFEAGGILNHILGLGIFCLLYSDFPLMILPLLLCFLAWWKKAWRCRCAETAPLDLLFKLLIPGMTVFFLVYNCLIKLMIFRTFTPYFSLAVLYGSLVIAQIWHKNKSWRNVVLCLASFMVLRGSFLVWIMSDQDRVERHMMDQIYSVVDDGWERSMILYDYTIPLPREELKDLQVMRFSKYLEQRMGDPSMDPGTLLITGAMEYCLAGDYILPVLGDAPVYQDVRSYNYAWDLFKEVNAGSYVGQSYPDLYYWLFGAWIRGNTLSSTVMPCNYIYYFPAK